MKLSKSKNLVLGFLTFLLLTWASCAGASADSKSHAQFKSRSQTSQSSAPTQVSDWLVPISKVKAPTIVQAGRMLPLKFRIAVDGKFLTITDMVKLSISALSGCSSSSIPVGTATVLVSPTPQASASASPSSSSSPSAQASPSTRVTEAPEVLRNENGTFQYNWKVPRNQPSGCYVLTAEKGAAKIISPLIQVKGSK